VTGTNDRPRARVAALRETEQKGRRPIHPAGDYACTEVGNLRADAQTIDGRIESS
jgi:hypothetical protein